MSSSSAHKSNVKRIERLPNTITQDCSPRNPHLNTKNHLFPGSPNAGGIKVVKDLRAFYDLVAEEYSNREAHPTTAQCKQIAEDYIRTAFAGRSFRCAMDIGCGDGNGLLLVKATHRIGIDFSIEMLKRHYEKLRSGTFILGDCERLLLPSKSIELAMCSFVLDHLHDIPTFLKEVYRVLTKGGLFILSLHTPSKVLEIRNNTDSFLYTSAKNVTFQVPSDFKSLGNLSANLCTFFRIKDFKQLQVANNGLSVDCYLLVKQ